MVIGFLGPTWAVIVIVVGLLSGAISVFREFQLMYAPPKEPDTKRVYWGFVRIAFVAAAILLWWDEHDKVKQLLKNYSEKPTIQITTPSVTVPPAQVVVIEKASPQKHELSSYLQFTALTPITDKQNNVIAAGNRIGFNFGFEQQGPEPVDHVGNVEMVSVVDITQSDAEQNVKKEFEKLRKEAIENTKKAGVSGHSLGIGQKAFNSANTRGVLTEKDVTGILKTGLVRIYAQGWLGWKDRYGNHGQVRRCVWLQPPPDGVLLPGENYIWDQCEEKE